MQVFLNEMAGAYVPASKQKVELPDKTLGVIVLPENKQEGAPVSYPIDEKGERL